MIIDLVSPYSFIMSLHHRQGWKPVSSTSGKSQTEREPVVANRSAPRVRLLVLLLLLGGGRLRLQLGQERVDARPGDGGVLLAAAAADADAADDLAFDDDRDAAVEGRDLAAADCRGVLKAQVEQRVGSGGAGGRGPVAWRNVAAVTALVVAV